MDRTSTDTLARGDQGDADSGLVRICGSGTARAIALPSPSTIVFGREAGLNAVEIAHKSVSRVHARIERDRARIVVTDLGSKNGTFVNGERIVERSLEDADEVRIGDVIFKLVLAHHREIAAACDASAPLPFGLVGGFVMGQIVGAISAASVSGLNVLVTGESGSGKELVARALHEQSRRVGPMRALNCAAIPTHLFESELFGYRRGAFTGADRDHVGVVRAAHQGTLFLDEIGDMPYEAQAKFLRLLETREVFPLGSVEGTPVDVLVVSATHQDLPALVKSGRFRGDLHARLNGFAIHLPPLRRRKEDLEMLVRHFLAQHDAAERGATDAFMMAIVHYDWPYNVRELAAAIQRAVAVAGGSPVDVQHLPEVIAERFRRFGATTGPVVAPSSDSSGPGSIRPSPSKKRPTDAELVTALIQHRGNVAAMARTLGKDRAQVHRWLRDARIDVERYRG